MQNIYFSRMSRIYDNIFKNQFLHCINDNVERPLEQIKFSPWDKGDPSEQLCIDLKISFISRRKVDINCCSKIPPQHDEFKKRDNLSLNQICYFMFFIIIFLFCSLYLMSITQQSSRLLPSTLHD